MGTGSSPAPGPSSFPVPPPFGNLPFGEVRGGSLVYLSVPAMQFLQELWASIQGSGGIIDELFLIATSPGSTAAQTAALIQQIASALTLLTPPGNAAVLHALIQESTLWQLPPALMPGAVRAMIADAVLLAQRPAVGVNPYGPKTVAGLAPVAVGGAPDFVTDSTVTAAGNFGVAVAGGGAHGAPVYYDSVAGAWMIG